MREKITPKIIPESSASHALNALNTKKNNTVEKPPAEEYAARGTKSRAEMMSLAKEKAEKIRARALELQNEERLAAKKRTEDYLADLQNNVMEEIVKPKPAARRKVSLENLDKLAEQETNPEEVAASVAKQEVRMGRKMTASSLDDHEARIAKKNERKVEIPVSVVAPQEKQPITPRNAEILARAKEIAQKVAAKKLEEQLQAKQKETIPEPPGEYRGDDFAVEVTSTNPKNQNEKHVLSYEDAGIPLKSLKRKKEWTGEPQKTRLVSGVEHAAIPDDLVIDEVESPKEAPEDTSKTLETPAYRERESAHEDPTLKQLHEEALHELDFLQSFCNDHKITLAIDEDTLDIINYEKLLREDLQRLEQMEDKEVAEEFLMLLGIASGAGAAYEFEKNKQIQEQKSKAYREKRAREEAALPMAEEIEEDLPEAEEVEAPELLEAGEMQTQKVEQEFGEQDKEILERDLKASWLVLLRKRRIAKQIEVDGKHLEFDTELPEKFNFSADGLLPQNAKEMWNATKEKGTEAQMAYIREFIDETLHYIDMLEKWESLEPKKEGDVELASESEPVTQEVKQESEEKETKVTAFNKVKEVRDEIKRRFPWVKFKNEKISTSTQPADMGFEDPKAVIASRVFTEGVDNPRTGEKSLRTLREDLRNALKAFDAKYEDKEIVYSLKGKTVKEMEYLPKKDFGESDMTKEELGTKAVGLYKKLKSQYNQVKFAQPKAGATSLELADLDILNLEELRKLPGYREEDPETGETLAEIVSEFNQTLEALGGRPKSDEVNRLVKMDKFVKVKEGDRTKVVREKEARAAQQRNVAEGRMLERVERDEINKERQFTDLLQKNPMPKELREFVESGKLNMKKDYFATGDAKEAVNRAMKELTTRISERNKKNGVFGLVSRLTFADKEHRNLKEVQKQLEHWRKYLR